MLLYFTAVAAAINLVFGESLGTILAASGIAGLAIGFALRGLLADMFSGIVLQLDSSLSIGEWIDVTHRGKEINGRLVDIQWRAVVIADRMENLVLIPNSEFTAATVVNRSRPAAASEYGAMLPVSSDYERGRVVAILETALARVTADGTILAKPGPYVRVGGLENGLVQYRLFYCVDPGRTAPPRAKSAVLSAAIDFLKSAGLHLYPVARTEFRRQALPGDDRYSELNIRLEALANVALLSVLSPEELRVLADASTFHQLPTGHSVLRAGETGDSMMVVAEGRLDVTIDGPRDNTIDNPSDNPGDGAATRQTVATVWPGEYVGEMSLLTGEPRSATVTTVGRTSLFEIHKDALAPILEANPGVVARIAAIVAQRRAAMLDHDPGRHVADKALAAAEPLMARIRHFFRLDRPRADARAVLARG